MYNAKGDKYLPDQVQPLLLSDQYRALRSIARLSNGKEEFSLIIEMLGFPEDLSQFYPLHLKNKVKRKKNKKKIPTKRDPLSEQVWYRLQDKAELESGDVQAGLAAWRSGDVTKT